MGWVVSKRSIFCGFYMKNSKKYRVNSRNFGKTLDKLTKVVYMGK